VSRDEDQCRASRPGGGSHLRGRRPAELPGEQGRENDREHGADGCRDPNRNEVVAEHRSRQPSEERRERRLVGVPPGEMVAKKPEIQLIAVIAVTRRGNEENRGQSRRN
jgi:hypothetical protein